MKLVIADDSPIIRAGLRDLLTRAGFDVVAEAADASGLLREVALGSVEGAIVDIRMPPSHTDEGLRAAAELHRLHPRVPVLVLSQYLQASYALRLLTEAPAGVGYLLKERVSDIAVVSDALRRLADGDCVIDPTIVSRLMRSRRSGALNRLTDRERTVLSLMAEGRSNSAIARRLGITERTLEGYIAQVLRKLDIPASPDVHRRVLAVLQYLSQTPAR